MSFMIPLKRRRVFATSSAGCNGIKVCEEDTPVPGFSQVLVEVKAAGLNFFDIYVCHGLGLDIQPPCALGLECAGIVRQVGKDISDIKCGDHVIVHCPQGGAFSNIVITEESNVLCIPHDLDFDLAASLTINYLTAYFTLVELGGLKPGYAVLIQSAAGGVGWAATQIAKMFSNVTVVGVASEAKHAEIKRNGVDHALPYDQVTKEIIMSICPEGVSIVLENLAGESFVKSQELLSPLGKVILIGAKRMVIGEKRNFINIIRTWWETKNVSPHYLIMESKAVAGFNLNNLKQKWPQKFYDGWTKVLHFLSEEKIRPRIDSIYQLEDTLEACKLMAARRNIGKIVLRP